MSFCVAWTSETLSDRVCNDLCNGHMSSVMYVARCSQDNNRVCLSRLMVATGAAVGLPACTQASTLVV